MGIVRPIVQTVNDLPRYLRDLGRLREVAQVLARHGFGLVLAGVDIPGLPKIADDAFESTPERGVTALQELGPTFVKLGQVLSTRPDLLPPEWIDALQRLQDDVLPVPWSAVQQQLAAELGEGWRARFREFDETPLATASIAQVHAAVLDDGAEVVVKVQRPGLDRVIRADLAILQWLARRLTAEFPEASSLDADGVVAEFSKSLLAELDYREEAKHQRKVAANVEGNAGVRVPVIFGELSTARVLCMERLRGVKIRDARAAGHDMRVVGERYLTAAYDMLFVHGFFHGDLHPGNVLVLPGDVVGLLDFGMMGRLTPQMRSDVIFIIFALQRGDYRTIARLFYEIAIKRERVDYHAIERDTVEFLERHWSGHTMAELDLGPYIIEIARKAADHGARVPSDYTMFFKALVTTEGLAKSIIAEVDPIAAAEPYFHRMVLERFDVSRLQSDLMYHALTLASVARRIPISLSQFLDDLDHQRLRLDVRSLADPADLARRDREQNRMIAAVVTVGFSLCGTVALGIDGAHWRGWPVVSILFFALAGITGGAALWMVLANRGRRA